jgi:hypothetical protein
VWSRRRQGQRSLSLSHLCGVEGDALGDALELRLAGGGGQASERGGEGMEGVEEKKEARKSDTLSTCPPPPPRALIALLSARVCGVGSARARARVRVDP